MCVCTSHRDTFLRHIGDSNALENFNYILYLVTCFTVATFVAYKLNNSQVVSLYVFCETRIV